MVQVSNNFMDIFIFILGSKFIGPVFSNTISIVAATAQKQEQELQHQHRVGVFNSSITILQ